MGTVRGLAWRGPWLLSPTPKYCSTREWPCPLRASGEERGREARHSQTLDFPCTSSRRPHNTAQLIVELTFPLGF